MRMDSQVERLWHLQAISKEATSCTLVTKEGERIEVQLVPMSFFTF